MSAQTAFYCECLNHLRDESDKEPGYIAIRLREGVYESFVDDPPSTVIARVLNYLCCIAPPSSYPVCIHGRSPCINRCGIERIEGNWVPMSHERRLEWFSNVYTLRPQRRDAANPRITP